MFNAPEFIHDSVEHIIRPVDTDIIVVLSKYMFIF